MFSRSTWLHLRFPFSFFLLPIFLFSLSVSPNFNGPRIGWVFFILHFLLYPASNGYNSYFDKDENSIGGLKHPPPVQKGLYYIALALDVLAVLLSLLYLNTAFTLMLILYGLVSKAYSHPSIRLKKYAVSSWLITGFFQGLFTFCMCFIGINAMDFKQLMNPAVLIPGLLTSLMLWANYPLTQVYQHEEDEKRGDHTLSLALGVKGTFYFSTIFFSAAIAGFFFYLTSSFESKYGFIFLLSIAPVLLFFLFWVSRVVKNPSKADYDHTLWMNVISSLCLNGFFIYLFLESTQVLQALRAGY